jgi:hypothetical protein
MRGAADYDHEQVFDAVADAERAGIDEAQIMRVQPPGQVRMVNPSVLWRC